MIKEEEIPIKKAKKDGSSNNPLPLPTRSGCSLVSLKDNPPPRKPHG